MTPTSLKVPSACRHRAIASTITWTIAGAILALATGCASTTGGTATALPTAAPASPRPVAAAPGQLAPFDGLIKDAQRRPGLLTTYQRQEKVWIELPAEWLGKPLFLSPSLASGIGEGGVFGGLMRSRWATVGRPQWVEFRRVHNQVQLIAVNAAYTAQAGTPQARAVAAAYSPSLLGSVPVASTPHPQTGAILIEANALFQQDLLGMAPQLQRTYRQSYGLDARNTFISRVHAQPDGLTFEVTQHFATTNIATTPTAAAPGTPQPRVPETLPDPRSLFVTAQYTLSPLPAQPMSTRLADPRVGYFTTTIADFTNDLARTPRQRYISRWRLERKTPGAPRSEPVEPIVFWLDASIPEAYRGAVTDGVLAWNQAFDRIGYVNAIQVRQLQPGEQPPATRRAIIRWMTNAQPGFGAMGPSHIDPRTGEILAADIALESLSARGMRSLRTEIMPAAHPGLAPDAEEWDPARCAHSELGAEQLAMGLDVLTARGALPPDSDAAEAFVRAYLKDTTMHEVGHALGLRHNFRASYWRSPQALSHPTLTAEAGNSASVMDYAPINLPVPGQTAGAPFQTTLGPYDHWAIEYGYANLPADPKLAEDARLKIAARSAEPAWVDALAYGTDEDLQLGLDPQVMVFDLGNDPVAFARNRLAIMRDLLARQEVRPLQAEDDAFMLRRSVVYGIREITRASGILLRQVGGVVTRRITPGSGQDALAPLPAATQRAAVQLLMQEFLAPDAITLSPALIRRLAPDYSDRSDEGLSGAAGTDFDLGALLLAMQRDVLGRLMQDGLMERLLDNAHKTRDIEPRPLTGAELQRALTDAVWAPRPARNPPPWRRNLQREHVNRLVAALTRAGEAKADIRSLWRQEGRALLQRLNGLRAQGDAATRAHIEDCIQSLKTVLNGPLVRTTP